MNLPFSVFLAKKYLRPKRSFLSVVTLLSVIGVTVGVMVLVVVLSVMSGFGRMWRDKILAFNAHLTVTGFGAIADPDDWLREIESVEGVTGAAPYVQGLVFLTHEETVFTPVLRGIDPEREARISRIPEHLVEGRFDIEDDELIIGRDMARRLRLSVGDRVLVYSPQSFLRAQEIRLPEEMTVAGIFDLGMFDFDAGYALCALPKARDLFGLDRGVHGLAVMTRDPDPRALTATAARVAARLGPAADVRTWMDQNRQLFTALHVEKNMMFFLLIFITVVAAFGIASTLITVTVQKTREIGLLKALGFRSESVLLVFLWQGWLAGALGTAAGIGLGLLALQYRNDLMRWLSRYTGLDLLPPALYHLSEIPSQTSGRDLWQIAAAVLLICTAAGLIPALRAARLDPARALRYE